MEQQTEVEMEVGVDMSQIYVKFNSLFLPSSTESE